jgi:carbamate kinase
VTTVIALGGNAVLSAGDRGTAAEQRARIRETCTVLGPLLEGEVVLTHGNGPQVGNELLRQERAAAEVPPLPLYLAVAQTQAEIGALLATELAATGRRAACLLTHVLVSEDDPAFERPTKPIGPFYKRSRARTLEQERGWTMGEDAGRGWRRTVPSPAPLEIVELELVRALLATDAIAIACGGGGIPVVRRDGRLDGIDAVIDKDRASALLAVELGAERLVVLTDVPALMRYFGTTREEPVAGLSIEDAEMLLPDLPRGSMGPKVEAAIAFAQATGGEALITSAEFLEAALAGAAGTRITGSDPVKNV